jgi:hypothetical protein
LLLDTWPTLLSFALRENLPRIPDQKTAPRIGSRQNGKIGIGLLF